MSIDDVDASIYGVRRTADDRASALRLRRQATAVTGAPGMTFREWCIENAAAFG